MSPEKTPDISYRTHPLRKVQNALQVPAEYIVKGMYHTGMLRGTVVADVLDRGETLLPDHVTITSLQLTKRSAKSLAEYGGLRYMLENGQGGLADAYDGILARKLNLASPDGAVKDVLADRIGENYIAGLIAEHITMYDRSNLGLFTDLKVAFNLSTLTKAASVMAGVQTREGGLGSMLQRRWALLFLLNDIGYLNTEEDFLTDTGLIEQQLAKIHSKTSLLIEGSRERAEGRIERITNSPMIIDFGWDNYELHQEGSQAAVEARKYAAVTRMNEMTGLDMVNHLNNLARGEVFPKWEDLAQRFPYIGESFNNINPFLQQALDIVRM